MDGFNFAVYRHPTGILMISADSLVGYLRSLEPDMDATFEDLADMVENMIQRAEERKIGR